MSDPDERALVVKAIKSGLGGCVEWDPDVIDRIRRELGPFGLTGAKIRSELIAYVQGGGAICQVKESRHEWKDRRNYYYKAVVPAGPFKKGLFVELVLADSDPDFPEVLLVNAHEQK